MLCFTAVSFAQQGNVQGTVTDATGMGLPGVNILVEGSDANTSTDIDGNFTIEAAPGDVLTFSYIGFGTQQVTIVDGRALNVEMAEDATLLDEIVVVGYGTQQKKRI